MQDETLEKQAKCKLPYAKPEVRFEEVFEHMALSCGKLNPNYVQCQTNVRVS